MLAFVFIHLFGFAVTASTLDTATDSNTSSVETELSEALPFPPNSRFHLKPYEPPGQPAARFDVSSVYMACAFGLFNRSLEESQPTGRSANHFYDLTSQGNDGPDIQIITQHQPQAPPLTLGLWTLEGIMQRLKRFRKTMPRMSFELHLQPRGPMDSFGTIDSQTAPPPLASKPDFSDIAVTPRPGARPIDLRDTFLASLKVFKRVGGMTDKDSVVTLNRNFAVGSVEMNFFAWPGQPHIMTMREVSRAAMAMLQYEKTNGEQFQEVRAVVARNGIVVGHAEINLKGNQIVEPAVVEPVDVE